MKAEITLIEDDSDLYNLLRYAFEQDGFKLSGAQDGRRRPTRRIRNSFTRCAGSATPCGKAREIHREFISVSPECKTRSLRLGV